jgi:putative OPT family oligopeptide transporter
MDNNTQTSDEPFIKASVSLPEITIKAVFLAIAITAVLAASNAYLALKLGTTIAASIPAAVIAMGALRFFRRHNILENNIVQTAASAGEGVAAAVAFVLPALVMMGYWENFHYLTTVLLTLTGGFMGVLFSIPLRRVMLNYPSLRFPEGTAIGNVLMASAGESANVKPLLKGGLAGGFIALCQTGFKLLADNIQLWTGTNKIVFGISLGFSPALLGAGFIIGMQACMAMFAGAVIVWIVGLPILSLVYGLPEANSYANMVDILRSEHIRYIGVGTMLLGGLWTLASLTKPILTGVITSIKSIRAARATNVELLRTEKDMSINIVAFGLLLLTIVAAISLFYFFDFNNIGVSIFKQYGITLFSVVFILVIGFFMASICAYLSGLVGMTNNPLSGLTLGTTLLASLLLLSILGGEIENNPEATKSAISIVLVVAFLVAIMTSIAGENIQDLKAGKIVGATPWKQQTMLLVGVTISALIIAPVLELLFQAYGIGNVTPRPDMDPAQVLQAPQAGLIMTIAQGTLGHSLPYTDIFIGVCIAAFIIIVDFFMEKRGYRLPVLAVGLGIYLPPDVITIVILGGIVNFICKLVLKRKYKDDPNETEMMHRAMQKGTLLACGLVAGAALMGVILAIPFVILGSSDALQLVPMGFAPIAAALGFAVTALLCIWLYRSTTKLTVDSSK